MFYLTVFLSLLFSEQIRLSFIIPAGFKINSAAPASLTLPGQDIDARNLRYSFADEEEWFKPDYTVYPVRLKLNRFFSESGRELLLSYPAADHFDELIIQVVLCDAEDESLCFFLEETFQPDREDLEKGLIRLSLPEPDQ